MPQGPGGKYLTATLCWNRHYNNEYPFDAVDELNNDLRLEAGGIDPNTFERVLLDVSDSLTDNVEHIYFPLDSRFEQIELVAGFSIPENLGPEAGESFGIAWTIVPDSSRNDPLWYDLNDDGIVDAADKLVFFMMERSADEGLDRTAMDNVIHLSDERLELLMSQWPRWKEYLKDWQQTYGQAIAIN